MSIQKKSEEVFGTKVGVPSIQKRGFKDLIMVSRATENPQLVFSAKEWEQLKELCEVLEPFQIYTDILRGDEVSAKDIF